MTEELDITINIDNMTIGDLELLERAADGTLSAKELVDFLDRIVEEDVRSMKLSQLRDITSALELAVTQTTNPETTAGN